MPDMLPPQPLRAGGTVVDETDVVIIGAGFAGLAAAVEARLAGASVLLLEKMAGHGGCSVISDGWVAAAGTPWQAERGIADSPERMAADMFAAGRGLNHPDLVHTVCRASAETVAWTRTDLGVRYLDRVDRAGGHSLPRSLIMHRHTGATLVQALLRRLRGLGADVTTRARLESLITGPDGGVTGARVRAGYRYPNPDSGRVIEIRARRGVILATGGFGADVGFRSAQDPRLDAGVQTTCRPYTTADGLVAAIRAGAAPVHLSHIQLGPWASPDEKGYGDGPAFASYTALPYGIVVDPATGLRFVNEMADRKTRADAILARGRPCVAVADAAGLAESGVSIDRALAKGVVRSFPDPEGLAEGYGMPAEAFLNTVRRFNAAIAAGRDAEFGKPFLAGCGPLTRPPFYAMRLWPKVHHTMGGVLIDVHARVKDLDGHPIPGLFAAGEVTGGIHGASRLGSCAITECLVFGRIAGRNAAAGARETSP